MDLAKYDDEYLLDHYAVAAMQALIAQQKLEVDGMVRILPTQWRPVVSGAFKLAEEMIRERERWLHRYQGQEA